MTSPFMSATGSLEGKLWYVRMCCLSVTSELAKESCRASSEWTCSSPETVWFEGRMMKLDFEEVRC